ncbi:hypothetical protein FO519_009854, partial [Halicephalobus sp. NKZ332]
MELVIKLTQCKIRLVQVHAPHSGREDVEFEDFLEHLERVISSRSQKNLLVLGDFNATTGPGRTGERSAGRHAAGQTRNQRGQMLLDFCEENSLRVANTFFKKRVGRKWTWKSNLGRCYEIDYFLTKNIKDIMDVSVVNGFTGNSDHRLVRCTLRLAINRKPVRPHKGIPTINKDVLKQAMSVGLREYRSTGNPNNDFAAIVKVVNLATRKATNFDPLPPRVTPRAQLLIELRKKLKENRSTGRAEIEYTECCKLVRKVLREDLRKRHLSVIQDAIEKNRLRQGRQALRYQRHSIINIGNGSDTVDMESAAVQRISEFYTELYKADGPLPPPRTPIDFIFEKAELERAMSSCKVRIVPGRDQVRSAALRSAGNLLAGPVRTLLNSITFTGNVPENLTLSNTILLFKKGDTKDIGNYRPISLLSSIYKVVAKVIKERVQTQADRTHALPAEQAGFRKKFSTITQIHALNEVAEKCYEFNMNLYGVFVDFKKAFDSISFDAIWKALREIECQESTIEVIQLFYSHGRSEVESMLDDLVEASKLVGLTVNFEKTKWMRQGRSLPEGEEVLMTHGSIIEKVTQFTYLGQTVTWPRDHGQEVSKRVSAGRKLYFALRHFLKAHGIEMSQKRRLIEQCIKPAVLYGCETWALTKTSAMKLIRGQRRIERAILGIRLSDKVRSKTVRKKTGLSDWLTSALERKWKFATKLANQEEEDWAQMTTLWRPKKTRPLGRPRTRWTDDLADELGCRRSEFNITQLHPTQAATSTRAITYARSQLKRWNKEKRQ